ncbi:necrosis-inducing protein [Ilyonectria robusta]
MTQKLLVASVSLFAIAAPSSVSFEEESFLAEQNILQRLPKVHDPLKTSCSLFSTLTPTAATTPPLWTLLAVSTPAKAQPARLMASVVILPSWITVRPVRVSDVTTATVPLFTSTASRRTRLSEVAAPADTATAGITLSSCPRAMPYAFVAPSRYVKYNGTSNLFPLNDHHPLLVYHEDDGGYCSRSANRNDIAHPENPFGGFYCSPLVGWNKGPSIGLRNKMLNAWKGSVGSNLDHEFCDSLDAAAGNALPGFNLYIDSQGANWPHL